MAEFKEVLKNKNFLFLWLGQITSQFGDRLSQMALIALIYARAPGSTLQLAKILSFTIIPVFLVGPVAAAYVDRWDRRRTMIVCDLLRAALVASLALFFIGAENLWPVYIILFLMFSVGRFFIPAKMAIIPQLVSKEKLLLANSLSSTSGMIAAVAGFGLGGLIVERIGSQGGFFVDALTYLVSGLMVFMIAARARVYFKKEGPVIVVKDAQRLFKKTLFSDIKEGWYYLVKDSDVRFIAQTFFLLWSAVGAVYIVSIVFVQDSLGSVTQDLGFLAMFLGLGLFLGTLVYGQFGQKVSRMRIIFISLMLSGTALSAFAVLLKLRPSNLLAEGLSLILGLTISPIIISSHTLIHEVTKEEMRGRIFGALEVVAHLGFLSFMFLTSFLAERIGRFWILLFVGIMLTIAGLVALVLKMDKRGA
ncbi:MFS transporter [Patescibacteria group bacterium]|nr:MFS transporter [Patescibacteria group bacterium]